VRERYTTINHNDKAMEHLHMRESLESIWGQGRKCKQRGWDTSSSSTSINWGSTMSLKHLPCDNQPNCGASTSIVRCRWWMKQEWAKRTMLSWWNGLTLPLLEVVVCVVCEKWFLRVGCNVASRTSYQWVYLLEFKWSSVEVVWRFSLEFLPDV
jgi:hypothetical protein